MAAGIVASRGGSTYKFDNGDFLMRGKEKQSRSGGSTTLSRGNISADDAGRAIFDRKKAKKGEK